MYCGGGCALNAIDRDTASASRAEPLLLAVVAAVAELEVSGNGIQSAVETLSRAFGCGLTLTLGPAVWHAGGAGGQGRLWHEGACLAGLPDGLLPGVQTALQMFLQAAKAQDKTAARTAARLSAGADPVFEVFDDGRDTGWQSAAARAFFDCWPGARQALNPAVHQALCQSSDDPVQVTLPTDARPLTLILTALPAGVAGCRLIRLQDRSETRSAQDKVARRDTLLRRLFDLSPVGIVLINFGSGAIIEANSAFLTFGSWQREDLIGVTIGSLLSPEHGGVIDRATADLQAHGRFGPYEHCFVHPDGKGFPAVLRGLLLTAADGQDIVWLLVEDVSEQRAHLAQVQAARDEALRAKAELDTAVQALPHGFVLYDAEDRVVMVNDQMAQIYPELAPYMLPGRRFEDVLRDGVAQGIFPEATNREEEFIAKARICRQRPVVEHEIELAQGRVVRILERATPTGGRVGLRIDATSERTNQRRLTQVIEGSQAGTWEVDFQTGANRVNDRWIDMLGWTRAELEPITLATWTALLHPDDVDPTMQSISRVMRQETDRFDLVFRLRHRDARWIWVQSRGHVSARQVDGTPIRMAGVHVDVSQLKAAELRLEQIIKGAEVGTWQRNLRSGITQVNDLWTRLLGYGPGELDPVTDHVLESLLHPDDFQRMMHMMSIRFGLGEWQFTDEVRMRHKQGHWVWLMSRGQVTEWDADGQPVVLSGVNLDISARKQLESDLEVERDFLSTLMETSVSGIMAVDDAARIVFFNREVQHIFELPSEALLNQVCDPAALKLTDMDGRPLIFDDLPCALSKSAGQIVRDMRLRVQMPDGRVKVVSVNAAMLPDPGMTARVVCTITDVTATARAEDDLRAAIDKAEAASRSKSQFLANMSHELRTPLNGVLGMAELLAEAGLDPAQRVMLDTIRESGTHLLSLVNDILDLAKIESGKLALDTAPLCLTDLAGRIDAMHGLAARRKGVQLSLRFGSGAARLRMADGRRVLQILHNLVGNAVKFTDAGQVELSIHEDPAGADRIILTVTDTGIGMSGERTASVFEEFSQGDGSITRRFGGTGLGLSIVRRLVALMDGQIALVSAPGQGTTVTVTLPMRLCDRPDPLPLPEPARQQFSGLRALLAEDNPTNRMILRAMLMRLGITVTAASDGDEALALWQPGLFDLVFLDISMPGKDGFSVIQDLQAGSGGMDLPPVLAVTAHAMAQFQQDYRAAGFAEVISKPVTLAALSQAIARATHLCPQGLRSAAFGD